MPSDPKQTLNQMLEASLLESSPLREIERDSLSELFRRINDHLVLGLPQEIPESDLDEMVLTYRQRRFVFLAEEDRKAAAGPKKRQPKTKSDLTMLEDL